MGWLAKIIRHKLDDRGKKSRKCLSKSTVERTVDTVHLHILFKSELAIDLNTEEGLKC
jgi:hypothetical protein